MDGRVDGRKSFQMHCATPGDLNYSGRSDATLPTPVEQFAMDLLELLTLSRSDDQSKPRGFLGSGSKNSRKTPTEILSH